ncbi:MAG: hypothetical protein RR575_05370 [Acinetobacter sp.]
MVFTTNNLTKFYWIALLIGLFFLLFTIKNSGGRMFIATIFFVLFILAIRSITSQVMIKGRKLIYKNLFIEKSINIIPESKIYIKRNIQSFFIIYQHYDYSIKVINPNEKLIISSNVNNVDELYALISSLEQKIILPVLLERYTNQKALIMDQNLSISTTGIKYKNKDYLYNSLSGIELENGYFKLLANGKLWQTTILTLPASSIPNLTTFMTLIHHSS